MRKVASPVKKPNSGQFKRKDPNVAENPIEDIKTELELPVSSVLEIGPKEEGKDIHFGTNETDDEYRARVILENGIKCRGREAWENYEKYGI
jgi:hypothetical protein